MDKYEYWFLDTAVKMVIGFGWIVPDEKNCLAINRRKLDLSFVEIADVLERLLHRGDLVATTSYLDSYDYKRGFIPSREQIEAALEQRIGLLYFLTPQGGKLWEKYSNPNWNQYYFWASGSLMCADREIAERLLSLDHLLNGICDLCIPGTEVWQEVTPWQATYWKSLPVGYQVDYQYREDDDIPIRYSYPETERKAAQEWYSSIRKWYTNYFDES